MGEKASVFLSTGDDGNVTNLHNGVAWYFSTNRAWASHPSVFLCAAQHAIRQYVCRQKDVLAYEERHYIAGWRCGVELVLIPLSWERSVWTRGGACVDLAACTADDDCAAGETCQNRRCLEPPPECLFELDCADGFVCEFGSCVEFQPECAVDTDCGAEEVCFESRCTGVSDPPECTENRECGRNRCYRSRCVPNQVVCAEDAQCQAGESCLGGVCRIACADNDDCPEDQQCEGGVCDWIPLGQFD